MAILGVFEDMYEMREALRDGKIGDGAILIITLPNPKMKDQCDVQIWKIVPNIHKDITDHEMVLEPQQSKRMKRVMMEEVYGQFRKAQ